MKITNRCDFNAFVIKKIGLKLYYLYINNYIIIETDSCVR